jgi:hypothetical protein
MFESAPQRRRAFPFAIALFEKCDAAVSSRAMRIDDTVNRSLMNITKC